MMKEKKVKIIKALIVILLLVAFSSACYFIFKALGISDLETLRKIVENTGAWGPVIFLFLQIICTTLLCFVPASSMSFITIGVLLFGANWKTFLLCFSGVIVSSVLMDLLGRFGLDRVFKKIIGEEDFIKAQELINDYGATYIPLFYLFPLFPDDAICCVAGSSKVNFWFNLGSIIVCRGIGVATIVFGISILPSEVANFTSKNIWDYVEVITILAFWVIVAFYITYRINKIILKKKKKNANIDSEKENK